MGRMLGEQLQDGRVNSSLCRLGHRHPLGLTFSDEVDRILGN